MRGLGAAAVATPSARTRAANETRRDLLATAGLAS